MGAEDPRSFSAIIAAKHAEFISYREAMKKLREFTGDPLPKIAAALKQSGVHEKHMAYLSGPEQAVRRVTGSQDLTALLDQTIEDGGIDAAWIDADDQADPGRSGWMRKEFVAALRNAVPALPCPETLSQPDSSLPILSGHHPDARDHAWMLRYKGRHQISLGDAAHILTYIQPRTTATSWNDLPGETQHEILDWRESLIDAISNAEIDATGWSKNRDLEQMLSHVDIRAWCAKREHNWPIPDPNPQPATASEAFAEIGRLKAEIERLRAELAEAKEGAYPEDGDQWPEEMGIALTAWRAAVNNAEKAGKKPGAYIRSWLDETYPDRAGSERHKRIAIVANWDKTPGPG